MFIMGLQAINPNVGSNSPYTAASISLFANELLGIVHRVPLSLSRFLYVTFLF